jgi:hypothetical protein
MAIAAQFGHGAMSEGTPYDPQRVADMWADLPKEVSDLSDVLAESAHDAWAAGRLREGWRYGSSLDRDRRIHPSLVPFSHLSYEERRVDREVALAVLQALIRLGFELQHNDDS